MLQKRHLARFRLLGRIVPVGIRLLGRLGGLARERHEGHDRYAEVVPVFRLTLAPSSAVVGSTGAFASAAATAEFCSAAILARCSFCSSIRISSSRVLFSSLE